MALVLQAVATCGIVGIVGRTCFAVVFGSGGVDQRGGPASASTASTTGAALGDRDEVEVGGGVVAKFSDLVLEEELPGSPCATCGDGAERVCPGGVEARVRGDLP